MDANEIKAKLDEVDDKLRAKLAELGFTPAEIERQLERAVPEDAKRAEREQILARKFAADLDDPSSGLPDAILAQAAPRIEAEIARLEAAARRRRINIILGAIAGAAVVLLGVWYFALRDTRSACEKLVGPLAELEKLLGGFKLEMRSGHETDYSCYQYVDKRDHAGGFVVTIETQRGDTIPFDQREARTRKYTEEKTFDTALGQATLFVAGDMTKVSTEQLTADIYRRVGTTGDPTGAALANLPPSQHLILMTVHGKKTIRVAVDHELFTPETAMQYAKTVATRAK